MPLMETQGHRGLLEFAIQQTDRGQAAARCAERATMGQMSKQARCQLNELPQASAVSLLTPKCCQAPPAVYTVPVPPSSGPTVSVCDKITKPDSNSSS